jgi:hypothetical protein
MMAGSGWVKERTEASEIWNQAEGRRQAFRSLAEHATAKWTTNLVLHNKPSVQVKAALRLRVRGTTEAAHMATNPISIPSSNTTNGWEQTNRDRNLIGIHEHDDAFLLFTTHACLATPVTHVTVTGERQTKKKTSTSLEAGMWLRNCFGWYSSSILGQAYNFICGEIHLV